MSFWTENTTEPKRNFRWRVTMSNILQYEGVGSAAVWWAKTVDTPSYTVTDIVHPFFDNEFKFPGRVQWQDVNMTLVDPISPNAAFLTNQIILESGYEIKNVQNFADEPRSISKAGANAAIGLVSIEVLAGTGKIVEKWEMRNPFITSVKYSTLDYSNDEMRTIDLTWKYDYATCTNFDRDGNPIGETQFGVNVGN